MSYGKLRIVRVTGCLEQRCLSACPTQLRELGSPESQLVQQLSIYRIPPAD